MKKIITGVKPTGQQPHIGNLVGAILPFGKLAAGNDAAIFLADLHALTLIKDADTLKRNSLEVALTYFALYGADTDIKIFRQSDIVLIPKLNWILNNVTTYSLMLRAHSFKDSQNKKIDLNMGVFNYPILMAADILGYDIDIVPIGDDQRQHLEMTRDIAKAFNKTYKQEVFKIPKEYIEKGLDSIPGIDGRKMSKSYDNYIGVFDDEKTIKKKVMAIVTDSKNVEEPKDPDNCLVFHLINIFGDKKKAEEIRKKYLAGGYGYGHAKLELNDILQNYIAPYREKKQKLKNNLDFIEEKLKKGAKIMNAKIEEKMIEVSKVVGV